MTFTTSKTASTTSSVVAQDEDLEDYPDRVSSIYTGKTILITGGTGFMGKVLVEKLLRCCTGVKKIYLLVRSKKGKDPNERLKDVFNNPVIVIVVVNVKQILTNNSLVVVQRAEEPRRRRALQESASHRWGCRRPRFGTLPRRP